MAIIDKSLSAVTTVFSGASVGWSNSGSTQYTAMTSVVAGGFDYAYVEVEYTSENTTDGLYVHAYSSGTGVSTAASKALNQELPLWSAHLTATPTAGSGVSKVYSFVISDVPYLYFGLVPEPSSTSHQVQVDIWTVRWVST